VDTKDLFDLLLQNRYPLQPCGSPLLQACRCAFLGCGVVLPQPRSPSTSAATSTPAATQPLCSVPTISLPPACLCVLLGCDVIQLGHQAGGAGVSRAQLGAPSAVGMQLLPRHGADAPRGCRGRGR